MTNASESLRSCPTRSDGAEVLIAHSISTEICHERQRRLYHKCFTCVHRGKAAGAGVPALVPRGTTRAARDEASLIRRAPTARA
jgi:hypothetical protein